MTIDKVNSNKPEHIIKVKLPNGDTRCTYKQSKCFYDESKDGSIKYYDSEGKLSCELRPNGDSYTYSTLGKKYSKVTPEGYVTLYNPDGSIKKSIPPVGNRFSTKI